jgi:hypothetical protein
MASLRPISTINRAQSMLGGRRRASRRRCRQEGGRGRRAAASTWRLATCVWARWIGIQDFWSIPINSRIETCRGGRDNSGMDEAEIERILRASRTSLGISASGAAGRVRRGVDPGRSSGLIEPYSRGVIAYWPGQLE